MALAVPVDDAKTNQRGGRSATGGSTLLTPLFTSRYIPDFPDAHFTQRCAGRTSHVHFHVYDLFKVFFACRGRMRRHDLYPYCVHFSYAYTPYGPFASDAHSSLTYLVMRPHYDPGSQRLSKELDQLKRVPDRQPWQITRPFIFPAFQSGTAA